MTSAMPIIIRAKAISLNMDFLHMCSPRKAAFSSWGGQNGKENYAGRSGTAVFKIPLILQKVVKEVIYRVIWFFLMGMIAGAVGWNMFVCWMGRRIKERQLKEAFQKREEKSHE